MIDNVELFKSIVKDMLLTYEKKNYDYGDSFENMCNKFGMLAAAIPLNNKVERINNLIINKENKVDESLVDSLKDLANYAIMTLIYINKHGKDIQIQ